MKQDENKQKIGNGIKKALKPSTLQKGRLQTCAGKMQWNNAQYPYYKRHTHTVARASPVLRGD